MSSLRGFRKDKKKLLLQRNGYNIRGGNSVKIDLSLSEEGSTLKGKILLQKGLNAFLLRKIPFQEGLSTQENKQEIAEAASLVIQIAGEKNYQKV